MSETFNTGALVDIKELINDDGPNSYKIDQIEQQPKLPAGDVRKLDWTFGPLKVSVEIDFEKREFGITASVLGISLGTFYATFDKGLLLDVNLLLAKGSLKFYIKNSALRVTFDVKVEFDGHFQDDKEIISW